jgi:hypothetical protein
VLFEKGVFGGREQIEYKVCVRHMCNDPAAADAGQQRSGE